jgi:hypothetical protein
MNGNDFDCLMVELFCLQILLYYIAWFSWRIKKYVKRIALVMEERKK